MGDWTMSENIKDMTPKLIGETWRKYPTETSMQKATYGLFECQYCGEEFEARTTHIKRGHTKSCGCLSGEKHGLTSHKFYNTWKHMVDRCSNPNNKDYIHYGARGIIVCEEWLDIRNFVDWAERTYPNTKGVSLDRIDNGKGYSPENCRWADATTQILNQRKRKDNTSGYTGVTWYNKNNNWVAKIKSGDFYIYIGSFPTIADAVLARDNYIIENGLPHPLSTDYKREEKINE